MEIDIEKALKKWNPILDALQVTDEKHREYMAEYAERHQNFEYNFENYTPIRGIETVGGNGNVAQNLLPVALKIFSKLNLEGKKVEFAELVDVVFLSKTLERNTIEEIKASDGYAMVQELEKGLIDDLVIKINEELKEGNTIIIDLLAQSISLISEASWSPRMYVNSKYKII